MKSIHKLDSGHELQQPVLVEQGLLMLSQKPLSDWLDLAGGTPCYLYEMSRARKQLERLRAELPKKMSLFYAVKANPNREVLRQLLPWVDGLDLASGGELARALEAGFTGRQCSFAGPSKSQDELFFALEQGVHLSVESVTELRRILDWAEHHQSKVELGLRINPQFELRASGMHMGGGAQPFGIDEEQVSSAIELVNASPWAEVTGLHIYAGSQCLQVDSLLEQYGESLACFSRLKNQFELSLKTLNLGGGLGVPYFSGNQPLDLKALGQGLERLLEEYSELICDAQIILEMGRFIMADAGYYVCRVNDVKASRGQIYAMVDGGLHHHLANSGNLGQLLRKNYPVLIANKLDQLPAETINIAGPLCTPLDVVAQKLTCPNLEVGDLVVVLLSGAYGLTASPSGFLSQPEAKELVIAG